MVKDPINADRVLAGCWSPPVDNDIVEAGKPVFCVATTFTFHASYFEKELLPRFLGLKYDQGDNERPFIVEREQALAVSKVCVMVDSSHVDPSQSTLRWDQLSVRVSQGLQHSKIVLLAWENFMRLIVSSANLTSQGYCRNREIAGILDFYNHASSTPKSIITDAILFLEKMTGFVRAPGTALTRVQSGLKDTQAQLRSWKKMPGDFKKHEKPRVFFMGGMPKHVDWRALSPIEQMINAWGHRMANEITVMTPFVGDSEKPVDPVIEKLLKLPHIADFEMFLVVPGKPSEKVKNRMIVNLPQRFLIAWTTALKRNKDDIITYVVAPAVKINKTSVNRHLHAKAIFVSDGRESMLFCGSSNFSQHGMGVRVYNIEANLCYFDLHKEKRGGKGEYLYNRLPVDWANDQSDNTEWPDTVAPIEDEVQGENAPHPAIFLWAVYNQCTSTLKIGIDSKKPYPKEWSISRPGNNDEQDLPLAGSQLYNSKNIKTDIEIHLPETLKEINLTCICIRWNEEPGKDKVAFIPVTIESGDHLVPPEEFRSMTVDRIIDFLYRGKESAEYIDSLNASEKIKTGQNSSIILDSLKSVDTERYLLYRTRRMGTAISSIGNRLLKTPHNQNALHYRLRQDPHGAGMLAEALYREWRENNKSGSNESDKSELSGMTIFYFSEIILMLSHVYVIIKKNKYRKIFNEALKDIIRMIDDIKTVYKIPQNYTKYLAACLQKAKKSKVL